MDRKELLEMDYWELRKVVAKLIPRTFRLREDGRKGAAVKEKGRKTNYHQYDLVEGAMTKRERLLNTEEVTGFLEISCRAQACPMPLNLDVYDGLLCGFKCVYCVPSSSKILMADGKEKAAGRMRVGDKIMSYNTETQKPEVAEIEEVMSREAPGVLVISTETATFQVTPEHPVFTKRGWIDAGQLTEEDEVLVW